MSWKLRHCVKKGYVQPALDLIDAGANIHSMYRWGVNRGNRIVHAVIYNPNMTAQLLPRLLECGVLNRRYSPASHPLNYALLSGNGIATDIILSYLEDHNIDFVEYVTEHDCVRFAVQSNAAILHEFLQYIPPDLVDNHGNTILHHAVNGIEEDFLTIPEIRRIIMVILMHGCPIDSLDVFGRSAYRVAEVRKLPVLDIFQQFRARDSIRQRSVLAICRRLCPGKKRAVTHSMFEDAVVDDGEICTICLTPFENNACKTKCGHFYHRECISKWWQRSEKCPVCQSALHLPA